MVKGGSVGERGRTPNTSLGRWGEGGKCAGGTRPQTHTFSLRGISFTEFFMLDWSRCG
ncbi:MAG: hypothetical protein KA314_14300 [Chloroflexi bacterium]|nr:hypothetical protein [Chloroflexota bacterium]MBP8057005.1 hypothetical protein [Chloroflexota bacterium]